MSLKDRDTNCGACSQSISKKQYSILCFNCDKWYHIKCVELSVSQVKYFDTELKKADGDRWKCPSCLRETVRSSQTSRKSISVPGAGNSIEPIPRPVTLEDIMVKLNNMEMLYHELLLKHNQQIEVNESLKTDIDNLNLKVNALETTLADLASGGPNIVRGINDNSTGLVDHDIMKEVFERQKRMNNLMIFNFNISDDRSDSVQINELFSEISGRPVSICSSELIGKPNKNGFRAMKVRLSNPADVGVILKNKAKAITSKKVYIEPDMTPKQLEELNTVRNEFKHRRQNGEGNIRIKFVNGIPSIVQKN